MYVIIIFLTVCDISSIITLYFQRILLDRSPAGYPPKIDEGGLGWINAWNNDAGPRKDHPPLAIVSLPPDNLILILF
jgi:hypothetical protein